MSGTIGFTVATEAQLNAAIAAIDIGGAQSAPANSYAITLTADFTLNARIAAIDLATGDTLTVSGAGAGGNTTAQLDGNNVWGGFVVAAGAVTLESLSIQNMQAQGGDGANAKSPGGGAAGLGGAVFVAAGASVDLTNVQFAGNGAAGGNGGAVGAGTGVGGLSGLPGGLGDGGAGGTTPGFGGGGGGGAAGGFGGGANGGGGLAAGGNIFVQQGGTLTIGGGSMVDAGTLTGGSSNGSGGNGHVWGSGIFIQGNATITLGSGIYSGAIADQSGSGGTGANAGAGAVVLSGGAVTLAAHNSYTGGTTLSGGTLTLKAAGALGSGGLAFTGPATLVVAAGDAPSNTLSGFGFGDTVIFQGIGHATTATLGAGNLLTLSGGTASVTLNLDPSANYGADSFILRPSGASGTSVTVLPTGFTAGSEAQLNAILAEIDKGGVYSLSGVHYSITLTGSFGLTTDLSAINLAKGASLTLDGGGAAIDGAGVWRGLFVYGGVVTVNDLTLQNMNATGGAGGAGALGGGGGAGLGGGLFVAKGAAVTLAGVSFLDDSATGGAGGAGNAAGIGGGGGLGGAGGAGGYNASFGGGGGGVGSGATGASGSSGPGAGLLLGGGGASGGTGTIVGSNPGVGAGQGGGGGISGAYSGSGRDPRSTPGTAGSGGDASNGNFGGGAGSGQAAGFGGGGAAFGGTVNGTFTTASGSGGFGGGAAAGGVAGFGGGASGAGGGGGLGAGGGIFVQQGGSLTIAGGSVSGGGASGGQGTSGGANGQGYGGGLFLQGSGLATLAPAAGTVLAIANTIADQTGSGGSGRARLMMSGAGTVLLETTNAYSGGTTLNSGTLSLQAAGAAGSGAITFAYGATAMLLIGAGDVPANIIGGLLPGDTIDLQGIGTATAATLGKGDVLSITGGATAVSLALLSSQIYQGESFQVVSDNNGGTLLTAVDANGDFPAFISGTGLVAGTDQATLHPFARVTVSEVLANQVETATVRLSSTADGILSNLGGGHYDAATGVYTVMGTAAAITTALQGLVFTPTPFQVLPGQAVTTDFHLSVTDGTMSAAATEVAKVTAVNIAPTITGLPSLPEGYWNVPMAAFAGVTVTDPNFGASETVTLSLSSNWSNPNGYGTLALANPVDGVTLTATGANSWTLSAASPAAVTAALDAVTFTSVPNPAVPGYTITDLGISVSDGIAPPVSGSVEVLDGLPILVGAVAGQATLATAPIDPFASAQVTDSAQNTSETVTITLENTVSGPRTDANGVLSGAGLTKVGAGTYLLATGTPTCGLRSTRGVGLYPDGGAGSARPVGDHDLQRLDVQRRHHS